MHYNFADLFEAIVDLHPDRTALVVGDTRRTFAEIEDRSNRLAHHLRDAGVGAGDHVGIYAYNGPEWVEGMMALYKLRAVPVNVNYRYVETELRYLCDNADLVALILQREFAPRVAAIRGELPQLRHLVHRRGRQRRERRGARVRRLRGSDRAARRRSGTSPSARTTTST